MASNKTAFGAMPKWPGKEAHLSDGTGSESEVRFSVHSTASKEQQVQMEPSRAQGMKTSAVSPGRGAKKDVKLEDWDPMEEDFNDNSFNNYNRGPGAGLLGNNPHQVGNKDMKYKLFVGNIPSEMTEEGLFNLFSQICDIKFTKVISRKDNTGYGFVEVPSVKDGEEAIRRLNGCKIRGLGLRVSFAREKTRSDAQGPRQLLPPSQASLDQPSSKAKLTNGVMPSAGGAHSSSAEAGGYASSGSNGKRKTPELRKVKDRYGNVAKPISPKGEPSVKSPTSSAPPSKTPLSKQDNPVSKSPLQALLQMMKYPNTNSPTSPKEISRNESTSKGSLQEGQKVTRTEAGGTGEVKSVGAASREIQFEGSSQRKTESKELIAKLKAGGLNLKAKDSEEGDIPPASPKVKSEAMNSPQAAAPQPLLTLSVKATSLPHEPSDAHQSKHQEVGPVNTNKGILGTDPRDAAFHQSQMSQPQCPCGQGYQHTSANCRQCDTEAHEPSHYHQPQHPWNGPHRYPNPHHAQYNQAPEGYPMYSYHHSMPLRYPRHYGPDPHSYAPQYGSVPPSTGYPHFYGPYFRHGTSRRGMHRGNFRGEARFHKDYYSGGFKLAQYRPKQDVAHSHPARSQSRMEDGSPRSRGAETDTENWSTSATQKAAHDHTVKSRKAPELVAVPNPAGRPSENQSGKATASENGESRRSSQRGVESDSESAASELCTSCNKPGELIGLLRCSRCKGTTYCSKECQREHWPTHKNSCRQISTPDRSPKTLSPNKPKTSSPRTPSSPKTASALKTTSPPKTTTTTILHGGMEGQFMARNLPFETPDEPEMEVFVTEVDSPSSVWLQIFKERTVKGFKMLTEALNEMHQGSTNSGEFNYTPKVGGLCAVRYTQDGVFYRGEILSIEDNNACTVRLMDFGTTYIVTKDRLRKLKDELLKLPKQALKCFLSGIKSPQGPWSNEAIQELQALVKFKKCDVEFKGQGAEGQEIELYGPNDSSASVSSILVSAGLARSTSIAAPSPSHVQPPSGTMASPPSLGSIADDLAMGRQIEVCISQVDSPGCFYANVVEFGPDLVKILENVNAVYEEMPAQAGFSPKEGDLCAARFSFDNSWYRAVVKSVSQSAEKDLYVTFIDYGNSDTVSLDECRPLEERFASLRKQAIQCKLAGVKPQGGTDWPDDLIGAFKEWLETAPTVNIVIKDKKGDQLVVEVFSPGAAEPECSFNTVLQANGFTDDGIGNVTNQAAAQASGDSVSTNRIAAIDQPSTSRATKLLLEAVVPESKFEGFITSVNTPLDFHLQVFNRVSMDAFKALTSLLNTRYSLQDLVAFTPRVGNFCAVKSSTDDAWYRALILEEVARESAFKVLFVDYGAEKVASTERIAQLEDRFFDVPMFGIHCGLAHIQMNPTDNERQSERAITYFTEKVNTKQFQVQAVRKEEGKCFVELLYRDSDNKLTTVQQDLVMNGMASLQGVSPPNRVVPRSTPGNPPVTSLPTANLPEDFQGYISAVGDRGDLYIQVISQENLDASTKLAEQLNSHYEETQGRPHQPSIGEVCVAKYSVDKSWYRAWVVELRATEAVATVLFVDYGNTETVSLDCIQRLEGDFLTIPQFCHRCYLSGVSVPSRGREWDSDATGILKRMVMPEDQASVRGFQVHVTKQEGEVCEVLIQYSNDGGDTWTSVNDELIGHFQSPGPSGDHLPANGGPRHPSTPANEGPDQRSGGSAEFESLPAGDPLTGNCDCLVTVVNNPSEFFIQIPSDENIKLYDALVDELHQCYEEGDTSPHEPKVGQLCAARFSDNAWYRACVVQEVTPESALKVMFVDYGNVEVVTLDEIRKLEGVLREVPEFSHRCRIHGMIAPSGDKQLLWSEETIKHLKSKLESALCKVDIVKNDGKIYEVEILYSSEEGQWVNIKEELQELELAEPDRAPPITSPETVRAPQITSPETVRAPQITSPETVRSPPITSPGSSPTTPKEGRILSSSLKKMSLPDSAIDVVVNVVVSLQEFYCQMCLPEENKKLSNLMQELQDYASNLLPDTPPYHPAVGDFCLAKFTDNFWYRAEVMKIKRSCQKALVKYIDFGNMEPLPWSQMCAAREVFADLPIQAIKCGLSGVPLGANSSEVNTKKFLQEECGMGNSFLQATFYEMTADMTSLVQLVEPESKRNINQIVDAYLNDAKATNSPDQPGSRSRTPDDPVVSPKVMTPGASPKVMTPGASPKVGLPKAFPKFSSTGASPKVMTPDPAAEAKKRETERKKKELEAKIEAQRRQLAEMERERASLEQ